MEKSVHGRKDLVFALKGEAQALQDEAFSKGRALKRAEALEAVAKKRGFSDWNAAVAAAHSAPSAPWRHVAAPLPKLPMRILRAGDRNYVPIREIMRWAQQMDVIADNVSEDARVRMLGLIGGEVPYVFVAEHGRWPDGLYRLCDRGYDPLLSMPFTRAQLEEIGVIAWQDDCGPHSGTDMVSLVHDDVRMTRDRVKLKQVARVLAAVAVLADSLYGYSD